LWPAWVDHHCRGGSISNNIKASKIQTLKVSTTEGIESALTFYTAIKSFSSLANSPLQQPPQHKKYMKNINRLSSTAHEDIKIDNVGNQNGRHHLDVSHHYKKCAAP